jgi:hypothetical protein
VVMEFCKLRIVALEEVKGEEMYFEARNHMREKVCGTSFAGLGGEEKWWCFNWYFAVQCLCDTPLPQLALWLLLMMAD